MYFPGKSEKTQKNPRFFLKPQENPRTLGRVEKTQIWGENPSSGNAAQDTFYCPFSESHDAFCCLSRLTVRNKFL